MRTVTNHKFPFVRVDIELFKSIPYPVLSVRFVLGFRTSPLTFSDTSTK